MDGAIRSRDARQAGAPLWVRALLTLASLLLLVGLLFQILRGTITSRTFFEEQYTALGQAAYMGMSTEELVDSTMQMIYYMEGGVEGIDLTVKVHGERVSMFNDRERAHMVDVRELYQNWRVAAYAFLGLYAIAAALALWRGRSVHWLTQGFLKGSAAFTLLALLLGAWVLLDFSSFWTAFHHLFFSNDLWLLDPASSRMINMMPLELFYAIVLRLAGRFLLVWAGLLALCGIEGWYVRGKQRRLNENEL